MKMLLKELEQRKENLRRNNMVKAKYKNIAAKFAALALALCVMASTATGAYAATEYWNDASTSADKSWEQWKENWTEIKDGYETVSLTPGEDESQLNLAWYSHKDETPKVRIAKTKNGLKSGKVFEGTQEATTVAYSSAVTDGDGTTYNSNKVTVTGLAESTKYYYQVYQNGTWQSAETFTTGDADNYSVIYVADPQIGACKGQTSEEGTSMADKADGSTTYAARNDAYNWSSILEDVAQQHPDLSFMISAGDQVNYANYEFEYAGFLQPSLFASLPLAAAIGNHDSGSANYSWHFNNPNSFDVDAADTTYTAGHTNAGSDYYYTYGDVLYIVLDTNNYNCATHENVIKKAVEANPDCTWRIVTFHQDIYGSGKDHSDSDGMVLRTQLTPIMDEYDIDIVLQGHDHTYSRTYQLTGDGEDHTAYNNSNYKGDENYQSENLCYNLASTAEDGNTLINPNGTVYFEQNSATGSKFYELIANQQDYIAERSQTWTPTYSILDVSKEEISITTYDASTGEVLEGSSTYTIVKKEVKEEEAPAAVKTDISDAVVKGVKSATANGKAQTLEDLMVVLDRHVLTEGKDYKVTYTNNVKAGTATVTITGINEFEGSISKNFTIKLAKPSVTLKGGKKSATVKWNKVAGADGYKSYVKDKFTGKYKVVKTVKSGKTLKATVKKLKKGNRTFKVRAYSKVNGKTIYSSYSTAKTVKVK